MQGSQVRILSSRYLGEVSEWFKVLVLKTSVTLVTEGSNPSFSDSNFDNVNYIMVNHIIFLILFCLDFDLIYFLIIFFQIPFLSL